MWQRSQNCPSTLSRPAIPCWVQVPCEHIAAALVMGIRPLRRDPAQARVWTLAAKATGMPTEDARQEGRRPSRLHNSLSRLLA